MGAPVWSEAQARIVIAERERAASCAPRHFWQEPLPPASSRVAAQRALGAWVLRLEARIAGLPTAAIQHIPASVRQG
jgi:hypothetical protein